jgi:hypothetical protein
LTVDEGEKEYSLARGDKRTEGETDGGDNTDGDAAGDTEAETEFEDGSCELPSEWGGVLMGGATLGQLPNPSLE